MNISCQSCREYCGNESSPGIDSRSEWRDWSDRDTTEDQRRIEKVLAGMDLARAFLLHVGIGNSRLAGHFATRVRHIDGISITPAELLLARTLAIANYQVFPINKYSAQLLQLPHRYDIIIDNNPSTFACCRRHFFRMLANYLCLLAPGGQILTDQLGLGWIAEDVEPGWRLTFDDLVALGPTCSFTASRLTGSVYSLRADPARLTPHRTLEPA